MDPSGAEDTSHANSEIDPPRLGPVERALWALLYLLPKNAMSRMAGRFARIAWPAPIQGILLRAFAKLAGVNLDEAAQPIGAYPTLQAFFTRALKKDARPIEGDAGTLVSPCDGAWGASGPIDGGTLLQVKGRSYRVRDLLGDVDLADGFEGGFFATLYLSPRDYHRFHVPAAGRIRRVDYWAGSLWPVNKIGLEGIDGLFARNERICAYLEPEDLISTASVAEGVETRVDPAIALVAVGATMVGSVRLNFCDLTTNEKGGESRRLDLGVGAKSFARGEEWGRFEFGSTIVLLLPPESFRLEAKPPGTKLRLGEAIGRRLF